jgi:Ni/Fe-hydrogenase subunit HybB-like protein
VDTATSAELREDVLRPLGRASLRYRLVMVALAAVVAWGVYAWTVQLRGGLAVTGMRDEVIWGLYITNFVFFIGISHAGTLISAILRLSRAEWRRPVTRMAEAITVIALLVGAVMPFVDMGRPDRMLNLVLYGRLQSPLVWDILAISTYLAGSLLYLYLPLIPDFAMAAARFGRGIRGRIYGWLSRGWTGTPGQRARLERAVGVMAVIIIPVAVSVHTVVAWIFGMTLRAGWDSTIFGPYFVVGAIFSGIASIIIVMAVFRRIFDLQRWLTDRHFRYLGSLLLVFTLIYAYFTISEYLTIGYKLKVGDGSLLAALLSGQYALPFWGFAVGSVVLPAVMLSLPATRRSVRWIVIAAVLVNLGMWLKRFVIVVPSLALPLMPYEWGVYRPTWVEWSITGAAFAGFALLFMIFARFVPILSVWEMEEQKEVPARAAPVPTLAGAPHG